MTDRSAIPAPPSSFWPLLIGMVLLALVLFQFKSIASLRSEVAELRAQQADAGKNPIRQPVTRPSRSDRESPSGPTLVANKGDVDSRLMAVEENIVVLNKAATHLMNRGQVPPDAEMVAEWKARFLNPETSMRAMFSTLRLLRANDLFDDSMATHAATLLTQSTNNGVTRALLDALLGAENETLKPSMLALVRGSEDGSIRWRAIKNLREFAADDPNVEAALWKVAKEDESRAVRERAEESLKRIPMTDTRQAALTQQAANTGLPFEERWSAFRVLGASKGADISELALTLAQASQYASDEESKLAYIRAFDDVNHEEFMLPLLNSIQDASAEVRLRATDALVDYKDKDPNGMAQDAGRDRS